MVVGTPLLKVNRWDRLATTTTAGTKCISTIKLSHH